MTGAAAGAPKPNPVLAAGAAAGMAPNNAGAAAGAAGAGAAAPNAPKLLPPNAPNAAGCVAAAGVPKPPGMQGFKQRKSLSFGFHVCCSTRTSTRSSSHSNTGVEVCWHVIVAQKVC